MGLVHLACSGSTNPSPTIAGVWHVTVLSLDSGTVAPSTFTVVITPVTESTFAVAMPRIVWSVGPVTYDTLARIGHYQGDSPDSTLTFEEWCKSLKCFLSFRARMNQNSPCMGNTDDPPPNTRLKLTAPSCCGNLLFVKSSSSRRSLGAFR